MLTIDVELQRSIQEGVVDPFNYVTKLRDQRNHMVQTEVPSSVYYTMCLCTYTTVTCTYTQPIVAHTFEIVR